MILAASKAFLQVLAFGGILTFSIVLENIVNRQIFPLRIHLSFALLYFLSTISVDGKLPIAAFICGFIADQLAFVRLGTHSTLFLIAYALIIVLRKHISSAWSGFFAFTLSYVLYYFGELLMQKITGVVVVCSPVPDFAMCICIYFIAIQAKHTRAASILVKFCR
ncbi:MAG: hypothetical protein LBJ89_02300 [Holosporales bacterium]|nr:hypothetical protein [Holosporales bacterium]